MLQLVAAGPLWRIQAARRSAAVAEVLDDGDFDADESIAAFAWPLLVQAGGLAESAGGRRGLAQVAQRRTTSPTLAHALVATTAPAALGGTFPGTRR